MLKRRLRLPRAGFSVQKTGKRLISSHFSLTHARATAKNRGFAVVISKKVAPKSVDRHRLKRQALSILRPYASAEAAAVLHARSGAGALPFAALRAELQELMAKSGLKAR